MADTSWVQGLQQSGGPKYLSLARALRDAIRSGRLPPGAQLPTVRDLAWDLKVTPGTVGRAYQIATQEGLLTATVGRGTFVAAAAPRFGPTAPLALDRDPARVAGKADLRSPRLPDAGQGAVLAAALADGAAGADWIDYPGIASEAPLRAAVADWLADRRLGALSPDDLALTLGGQNAVFLALTCLLRGDRPGVLIEELAYPGFRHAARLARADVTGVEIDAHGMRPEALDAACRRHAAQVVCLTPDAQNPTAGMMPLARRQEIVAVARAHDLQIIEDDCYAAAGCPEPSLRALAPERTWHIGSLSKTVSAALRFGWVAAPQGMGRAIRLTAQHAFFALPRPVSDLCLTLLTGGEAERLRAAVGAALSDHLQAVVEGLAGHDLAWQPGLPFAWLRLPSGWRASTFTREAEAAGVLLKSADEFAPLGGRAPHGVRLALNGTLTRAETAAACSTLDRLLRAPPSELSV